MKQTPYGTRVMNLDIGESVERSHQTCEQQQDAHGGSSYLPPQKRSSPSIHIVDIDLHRDIRLTLGRLSP